MGAGDTGARHHLGDVSLAGMALLLDASALSLQRTEETPLHPISCIGTGRQHPLLSKRAGLPSAGRAWAEGLGQDLGVSPQSLLLLCRLELQSSIR